VSRLSAIYGKAFQTGHCAREGEIQNVMASVVHPHFRERLGQFRDKTMRSSAVVVDLDRHEAGTSTS
jgi:hypothetical protein